MPPYVLNERDLPVTAPVIEIRTLHKACGDLKVSTGVDVAAHGGHTVTLIVTHDTRLAADVSDHVVFLHQGKIAVKGPQQTLSGNPQTERLQGFLSASVPG